MTSFDINMGTPTKWHITRPLGQTLRRPWHALKTILRDHRTGQSSHPPVSATKRDELLANVRIAIRLGLLDEAEKMVAPMGDFVSRDADCLNLLGVIHEARHAWTSARRYYGKAIRTDRSHRAAQQNMRRFYELNTFGRSRQIVALGDERPALAELLRARARSRNQRGGSGDPGPDGDYVAFGTTDPEELRHG